MHSHFGEWNSIYRQFRRWTAAGVWDVMLEALDGGGGLGRDAGGAERSRRRAWQRPDDRFHPYPGPSARRRRAKKRDQDRGLGRSRGGFSTKIHLRSNALGLPVAITPGHTIRQGRRQLPRIRPGRRNPIVDQALCPPCLGRRRDRLGQATQAVVQAALHIILARHGQDRPPVPGFELAVVGPLHQGLGRLFASLPHGGVDQAELAPAQDRILQRPARRLGQGRPGREPVGAGVGRGHAPDGGQGQAGDVQTAAGRIPVDRDGGQIAVAPQIGFGDQGVDQLLAPGLGVPFRPLGVHPVLGGLGRLVSDDIDPQHLSRAADAQSALGLHLQRGAAGGGKAGGDRHAPHGHTHRRPPLCRGDCDNNQTLSNRRYAN
ncbi:MAG: transposase [Brevundimonas sp.]|nr:transposase [Brevundimonas sp.]